MYTALYTCIIFDKSYQFKIIFRTSAVTVDNSIKFPIKNFWDWSLAVLWNPRLQVCSSGWGSIRSEPGCILYAGHKLTATLLPITLSPIYTHTIHSLPQHPGCKKYQKTDFRLTKSHSVHFHLLIHYAVNVRWMKLFTKFILPKSWYTRSFKNI